MDLKTSLSQHSQEVNQVIESFFDKERQEAQEIDRYLVRSLDILQDFTLRGGKSIRSYLGRIGFEMAGGVSSPKLLKAVASIEMHHKHILILDDISDRDERRYGGPTVEYSYREVMEGLPDQNHRALSFAMLDGVFLGSLSKELLLSSGFPSDVVMKAMHLFHTIMFRDVLAGWQIHGMQCTEALADSSQEEFIKGLRLVTASYTFEGPLLLGLTLAQNEDPILEQCIRSYGVTVGTAFQIQDDILGLYGDPSITGKPVGNDVREGKKTLLIQEAYKRASASERQILESACGQAISKDTLHLVQKIVKDTGSLKYSQTMAKQLVEEGIENLSTLPESESKKHLIELAHYIILREK